MDYQDLNQFSQSPQYDCLLFDLDDTLYPFSSGIAQECRKNIEEFMIQKLGIEENKISEMCTLLYKAYGTTMAGLRAIGYDFDYDEFHAFVHGRLTYEKLKPDPVLRSLLLSLPQTKVIFTNADKVHAAKVLNRLGLEDCFEGIMCFETLNPTHNNPLCEENNTSRTVSVKTFDIIEHFSRPDAALELPKTQILCKPSEVAIEKALEIAGINPQKTIFFDDNIRNIQSGKIVGLHTVLVGTSHKVEGADFALENIHNIKEALPELWEANEKSDNMTYSYKVPIETNAS